MERNLRVGLGCRELSKNLVICNIIDIVEEDGASRPQSPATNTAGGWGDPVTKAVSGKMPVEDRE